VGNGVGNGVRGIPVDIWKTAFACGQWQWENNDGQTWCSKKLTQLADSLGCFFGFGV